MAVALRLRSTGSGDVLPGFGDRREIELLVEAGFSRTEAIKIAALKGAVHLGKDKQIGSIALGQNADLVVIKHAPPDIMCTGEWGWLRCPRKCTRSAMSAFVP